jgi:hypothetical protein
MIAFDTFPSFIGPPVYVINGASGTLYYADANGTGSSGTNSTAWIPVPTAVAWSIELNSKAEVDAAALAEQYAAEEAAEKTEEPYIPLIWPAVVPLSSSPQLCGSVDPRQPPGTYG